MKEELDFPETCPPAHEQKSIIVDEYRNHKMSINDFTIVVHNAIKFVQRQNADIRDQANRQLNYWVSKSDQWKARALSAEKDRRELNESQKTEQAGLREELIKFYRSIEDSDYLYPEECEMHVDDYLNQQNNQE